MHLDLQYKPGTLVAWRGREWVVQPSNDSEVVELLPLGGHETERTGLYLPLARPAERPQPRTFDPPSLKDLGDLGSALVLADAARLALRSGAGPFRSFGRLSVRPRAYQLVPLLMALKQDPIRLLIADDVGVGKTVEALLIVREVLDRGLIQRFAVLCPPHLCDQWQVELREKFGIEAVVVRPDTIARLEREVPGDEGIFSHFRAQVISIDYVKSGSKRPLFLAGCPELVVVDEVHTCARPPGAPREQQLRHRLLADIAEEKNRHLVLLTATPHSGKEEAFRSVIGLLNPEFETDDLGRESRRRRLARHFVQRRRGDIKEWLDETTPFPRRISRDVEYTLHPEYEKLFFDLREFARGFASRDPKAAPQQRMRYWTALNLLRGVLSSPKAGARMLKNKAGSMEDDENFILPPEEAELAATDPLFDERTSDDAEPGQAASFSVSDEARLLKFASRLEKLADLDHDHKAAAAIEKLADWLKAGHKPIVFCRFIGTAEHFGQLAESELKRRFGDDVQIAVVTSNDDADRRAERVAELAASSEKRVLIATDCLSEGINLQEHFDAVLHYDLPWNPNRLEQREGRVDRFGQTAPTVQTALLVGKNNPIDGVVLRVLIEKAREIKKQTGVTVPLDEDSKTVLDAVLSAVLLNPNAAWSTQLTLDFESRVVVERESEVGKAMDAALEREKQSRSIYAQHGIRPEEIEPDLVETDSALGNPATVERFVRRACDLLGIQLTSIKAPQTAPRGFNGYRLYTAGMSSVLQEALPKTSSMKVCFIAPVPEGYVYLGRNHRFVEALCGQLMRAAFDPGQRTRPARTAIIRTDAVTSGTTLVVLRVRNVIAARHGPQFVAEEVHVWGYRGLIENKDILPEEEARRLLETVQPTAPMSLREQQDFLIYALAELEKAGPLFEEVTRDRTKALIDAHERYRASVGGSRYQGVEPVLPPDVLGVYVLLPA